MCPEPHPVSNSNYFAVVASLGGHFSYTNGQSAVDEPITGIIVDGENGQEIVYSRFRHDMKTGIDGEESVGIDGGRDYVKINGNAQTVNLRIAGSELVVVKTPTRHIVTLSNGERIMLQEKNEEIVIGHLEKEGESFQKWLATISNYGVLVSTNLGDSSLSLTKGLGKK